MGQDDLATFTDQITLINIADKLIDYNDQLLDLQEVVSVGSEEDLSMVNKHIMSIDLKWNNYKQWNQAEIANSDSLLQIVADFEIIKQELIDSIAVKKDYFDAERTIAEAEVILFSQDSLYSQLNKEAMEYSLVEKLAPLLEKLKVKEQLIFAELQEQYDKSKEVGAKYPNLLPRSEKLEEKFIDLKNSSEKIQAIEYKSLFERVKDYLFGFAAVSMILMFLSVIQSKIKVWKQNLENAKKYKEMMGQNNDDYPTI